MIVVGVPTVDRAATTRDPGSGGELAAMRTLVSDTGRRLRERADRSPLLALGITVAAGFVLGRILSGRR